ncbi:MAG: hypothetical protein NC102_02610 [Clostridium sp.]|nr:hypothetical protein [Clostridium sp.]
MKATAKILCLVAALMPMFQAKAEWVEDYQLTEDAVYTGNLEDGNPDGYGTLRYEKGKHAGSVYSGHFSNGYKQGLGKWTRADGTVEFGEFVDGLWSKPAGQAFNPGDLIYGIDLSAYNKGVDLSQVAIFTDRNGLVHGDKASRSDVKSGKYLQPVQFAYVRATVGASDQDSLYARYSEQAKRYGIPKGSYHLLCYNSDPEAQADNFIKQCNGFQDDDLIPVVDIELLKNQIAKAGKKNVPVIVDKFLRYFRKKTGIKPIIYTNNNFAKEYLDLSRLKGYTLWVSRYHYLEPDIHPWYIWQFSENGKVRGYGRPLDLNFYDGNRASFNRKVRLPQKTSD